MFKIVFTKFSQKQYNRLPKTVQPRIARALAGLHQNPFIGKKLGGELAGLSVVRAWPYRVLYQTNTKEPEITIISISHRQGAYN